MRLFGKSKKSKKKISLNLILPFMFFGLLASLNAALFSFCEDETKGTADIQFWSVYDDSDVFVPLIKEFNKTYKNVKITYHKQSFDSYEGDLINALAAGRGPDIFAIQNNWLPKHMDKLAPAPDTLMTIKDFQDTFVDVAAQDFIASPKSSDPNIKLPEKIYAVPLFVDTLAIYWNKDIFNTMRVAEPPKDWNEFNEDVVKLTVKDINGNIIRPGATIGTANNVNRASDILSLLMLQTGTQMVNDRKDGAIFDQSVNISGSTIEPGQAALKFYTNFADPKQSVYTWNQKMDYSIDAFSQGRAAMMINYSYHINTIKAKDPHLNFAVAQMPQAKGSSVAVNYANYWGLGVSDFSIDNNKKYAWIFLKWLAQKDIAQKYLQAAKRPASRRDLIPWQKDDPELGVFASQALSAKSWYEIENNSIDTVFNQMIDSVVQGQQAEDALSQAAKQITLLMKK